MKVAVIMPLAEHRGGAEAMLLHLMQEGRRGDVFWLVIFLEDGPMVAQLQGLGVDARVVRAGRLRELHRFIRTVMRIARIVRRERAHLILGWAPYAHLHGSLAAFLAGVPACWYQLGMPPSEDGLDRAVTLLPARCIIACSEAVARAQAALWPSPPVRVVYPGVELDRFRVEALPTPPEARRRLGLPAEGPLIGIVGRLQRWKGIHVLIEAMPRVLASYSRACCVVVGGAHKLEPEYPAYVESRIAALGLHGRVIMAGLQSNVPEWMQAMDVVVHASDREPFGIVVIEAMALGKPVAAGDAGGPSEIITDGVNGLLVPYGDAEALARAILRYLDDRGFAREVGIRARQRALEFSTQEFARNLIAALRGWMTPGERMADESSDSDAPVYQGPRSGASEL